MTTRFAIIPEWVLYEASPMGVKVYGVLRRCADKDGCGSARRKVLAEKAGIHPNTLDLALKELVGIGAIRRMERRAGNGARLSNGYETLLTPFGQGEPPLTSSDETPLTSDSEASTESSSSTENRALEPSSRQARQEAFETFWPIYPRHAGRRKAQFAFDDALARASAEVIIAGAVRYRDDPNREDAYTAHPATWLAQDRWLDDPLPPRRSSNGRSADAGTDGWAQRLAAQAESAHA